MNNATPDYDPNHRPNHEPDHFIVCGLGGLGQQTILNLKKISPPPYAITIAAIDLRIPAYWEGESLLGLLTQPLIVGDSRRYDLLTQAGIERCRTILILTSNESVNVETALVARRLNPSVHIVLRSSRYNLNQLLRRQLGQFIALDAMELPANTFALAGLGDDVLSLFKIDGYTFRVVQRQMLASDPGYVGLPLQHLHRRDMRLLDLKPQQSMAQPLAAETTASRVFHQWPPEMTVCAGDELTYIEIDHPYVPKEETAHKGAIGRLQRYFQTLSSHGWHRQFLEFWQQQEQTSLRRITLIALGTSLLAWITGTLLIKEATGLSWERSLSLGVILLLGGYGDVFGGLEELDVPLWLPFGCLLIALASLFLVLSGFSLLADQLISSRFDFLQRRPRLPESNHVILVGLGRLGKRSLEVLQEFHYPFVAIAPQLPYPELADQVPVLTGNVLQQLQFAHPTTARSVIAVTDDPMLNLEIALIVSEAIAAKHLPFTPVIRTDSQALSENIAVLLPQAKAFSVYALSGEAFAGAAFGENVLSLFRLRNQTILVTEYVIEAEDNLNGKLLAEIAYGHGVVPILLKTHNFQGEVSVVPMPADTLRPQLGDRLYLLASINGLKRIERGEITQPRHWQLHMTKPLNEQVLMTAGNTLMQLSGLELSRCRELMQNLPVSVDLFLYDYQVYRLHQELRRCLPIKLWPL